jgi:NAD(P)-dependent dehydrogenase (short-subunit alcohol dehydrogenase family)
MRAIIFGASGSIGNYIFDSFKKDNIEVIGTTTDKLKVDEEHIYVDLLNLDCLNTINNIDIIVWAQGYNFNDNIHNFDENNFDKIMNGNVKFILVTLNKLLTNNQLNKNCKMVIVSSIWEELTRDNKLSYSISKSALSGLVKNIAYDLSKYNMLVNNILPGVIDNEMSRKTLLKDEFEYIQNYTYFNRLINLDDIYKTIKFLTTENTGITGQSIKIDLGFTNIKKYS